VLPALLVLPLVLAGCLAPGATDDSGIFGVATMGPTCPVERDPPDPNCADRPYAGELIATSTDRATSKRFTTDAEGRFNVTLPPGTYFVGRSSESGTPPTCASDDIVVTARGWTPVDVSCDTGIR
jgi:hypothetical protein